MTAPIDISALRHERQTRSGHHMLAHLRTEAYPVYGTHVYPPIARAASALSYEENLNRIATAKDTVQENEVIHYSAQRRTT